MGQGYESPATCSSRNFLQDFILTNVKGSDGDTDVYSIALSKSHDWGLDWSLGYAYTDSSDVNPMTSSVAFSNYVNVSVSDPNDPGVATSNYVVKNRFTLVANYRQAFFGDNETKITLYGRVNEGRPFSPVFVDGGFTFGDTLDDRHLLYIPTGPSDPNVSFGPNFDQQAFFSYLRSHGLMKYAGGVALETTTALKPGDYVVHLEHGVGIYRGIEKLFVRESTIEVAVIEYEGGDRLNVPLYRLDQIERYRAALDSDDTATPPRLHKLGGRRWKQQRDRTQAAIQEMTMELLQLYARRQLASRPAHVPDTAWQRQLESSFLFEDTPDQRTATTDVKRDMERPQPMDRLLVGDVGYGKTEVAVRAAFKAVQSGRQLAVLVPTTILAEQHARTFGERLADFPVRVATLSRFLTAAEQAKVVSGLAEGTVDIVHGALLTAQLLSLLSRRR